MSTAELDRLRAALLNLAVWADDCLNDGNDLQYIVEYLTRSLFTLTRGEQPEPPPF